MGVDPVLEGGMNDGEPRDHRYHRLDDHTDVQRLIGHGLVNKAEDGRVSVPWVDVVVKLDASLLNAA